MKEKITAGVGIASLFLSIMVGYANIMGDMASLKERVDNLQNTNIQTLDVLNRLAESVDKLSHSVARLDERTKALEREE